MNAPASFKNPFFITRLSANIMEDLHRQISVEGTACLLYGVEGVGKTRLLRQFIVTRLAGKTVKFCRLTSDGFYLNEDTKLYDFDKLMPTILNTPSNNSIWIIDQLELSSETFLQQLFKFWSQHGSKLSCALVLACKPERLGMVYKISEQLTLKIPSIELKPLSEPESLQYISKQLCSNMDMLPVLPNDIGREFKLAAGVPGQLDEIVKRYAGVVDFSQNNLDRRKGIIMPIMLISLLAVAAVIYSNMDKLSSNDTKVVQPAIVKQFPRSDIIQRKDSVIPRLVEPVILVENKRVAEQEEPQSLPYVADSEAPVPVQKIDTISVEQSGEVNTETENFVEPPNLLQQRLSATNQWLQQSPDTAASIQIMSLVIGLDPQKSLLRYFYKLEAEGINLQKIFVYKMNKAGDRIYVVLFGNYENRAKARVHINDLPALLKANGPIARSVGGIKNEIEEGEN